MRQGLALYRAGLLFKVWVIVGGYVVALVAALAFQWMPVVKAIAITLDVVGGLTSVVMLAGMARVARIDPTTGARGGTTLGLALLLPATLADLWLMTLGLLNAPGPMFLSDAVMVQTGRLNGASQILGLCSLVALVPAFHRLGRHLGQEPIQARARRAGFAMLTALIAVAALHGLLIARARVALLPGLLLLALLLAAVALTLFLRLVGELLRTLPGAAQD